MRSYIWTVRDISSQAKEHWWTEDSLAVNMRPAATGLNKQSHTELHKRLHACVKAGMDIQNVLLDKLSNDNEHWTFKWLSTSA